MEIKAIIFDFDATLMDTEEYWYLADKKLLSEFNIDFTKQMKEKYIGKSLDDMVNDLHDIYNLKLSKDEVKKRKNRLFLEVSTGNVTFFPQMKKLYGKLKQLNIPLCIATGTDSNVVKQLLAENNILDDFKFIISADQVARGKPFPDIFIELSKRLKIEPKNILVFEDSPYGVEAALAANMNCVAIPYLLDKKLDGIFYKADLLIEKGMEALDPELVLGWIKR